jgi:hypothetical protein
MSVAIAGFIMLVGSMALSHIAVAQQFRMNVCPSQQQTEQILQSDGKLRPDDCRAVTVTRIEAPAGALCVLDFGSNGEGILGSIRDATMPTKWWTACANLHAP